VNQDRTEDHSDAAVVLEHVTVAYGRREALRDVSVAFPRGATGLLGPNGAGKSTLLRALLGFVAPSGGRMCVLGRDVAVEPLEVRARVGYMPETDAHIPGMTAIAFVAYCGELAGLPRDSAMQRAHEVLFYVGLGEARYRAVDTYSTGMKQRIKLAQALVHDPELLFLDEPTNGMDPTGREEMLALVRDIATAKAMTVILSSHLLPDVEVACDYAVVLHKGGVAAQGPIATLKGTSAHVVELRVKGDQPRFADALRAEGLECHGEAGDALRVYVPDAYPARRLFELAVDHGVQVRHLRASVPSLDDVFARALGEEP
jgi:ABC-2 type transport system ATP-binding protein